MKADMSTTHKTLVEPRIKVLRKPFSCCNDREQRRMRLLKLVLLACIAIWVYLTGSVGAEHPANDLCAEAMTTVEMRECLNKRYQQVDASLNQLYQQLMSQLSKTRQARLREAQQAWMLFRDKNAAFVASETEGGTMQPVVSLSVLVSMTEKRVAELKDLLQHVDTR
jgi:uncharacterized protein YecT (DUF1311 family)